MQAFSEQRYSIVLISALIWLGLVMALLFIALRIADQSMPSWEHVGNLGIVLMVSGRWVSHLSRIPVWGLPNFRRGPNPFLWGFALLLSIANFVFGIIVH